MSNIQKKTIDKFFDEEYRNYAMYVIEERAIPSVIDGFKPTQRKVIFASNRHFKPGSDKVTVVEQLGAHVASTTKYHHGAGSVSGAIVGMTQTFKNSMPLFYGDGQFGSLREPSPAAPRYIKVNLNENFHLLYKDFELLTPKFEEGEEIEPEFFLPIIPAVLLNGTSGIAVGFATNILNRHPIELIDSCLDVLMEKKKIKDPKPWINKFKGTFARATDSDNSWIITGKHEILNTTTVRVTEIVPGYTFEDYETYINKLLEKGIITSYEDNSNKSIDYTLKFTRAKLSELMETDKLPGVLKMNSRESENFTTLDEHGSLRIFQSAEEIIRYFVKFRLTYYQKRKDHRISTIERQLLILSNRARFIKGIIDEKIKVNKVKRDDLIRTLETMKFDKVDDSFGYLIGMPIYSLTFEKYEELLKEMETQKTELATVKSSNIRDTYTKDLTDLKKKIEKDFK